MIRKKFGRRGITLAAAFVSLAALAACGSSTAQSGATKSGTTTTPPTSASSQKPKSLATVSVGIIGANTADWPLLTAEAEGYFKQEGISIKQITTGSPVTAIDELSSGQLDIASDGTDSYTSAVARGLPVEIVAPEMIADPYSLITAPSITSWSQLKGKTVVLGTDTDVTAMTFDAMAKAQGLTKSDFTYLTSGSTNTRYTELTSGRVQGAILTQPFDLLAEAKGYHNLASGPKYLPQWLFTADGANTNWAKSHPTLVVDYIKALEMGVKFDYANPAAAEQIMVKATKVSASLVDQSYKIDFTQLHGFSPTENVPNADIQAVFSGMEAEGTLKTPPPISSIYNTTYVKEANS